MLPLLPANLRVAGNSTLTQYKKLFQPSPVSHSETCGSFSLQNYYNKFIVRKGPFLKTAGWYAVPISNNKAYLPPFYILSDSMVQSNIKPPVWKQF
jgi:hypothetical protein